MTRVEHVVSPAADVTVRPATPGGHGVTIYDGDTTVVLWFGSARLLAGFVAPVNTYLLGTDGGGGYGALPLGDMASTGRWEDQGSAGEPVGESGEGGSVATTRALPADPPDSGPQIIRSACGEPHPLDAEYGCQEPVGHPMPHLVHRFGGVDTWAPDPCPCPGHPGSYPEEPDYCDGSCVARGGLETL